ncbi:uncharacterized protein [Drosophila takahashii]|uniref:uncharacterized protein n=1 Tax=Drosophila takahashii TaxID=29030 RepID=UPI003899596A
MDRSTSQHSTTSAATESTYIPSGCRLPPCDTEVFEGDYLKWPTFRDLSTAVYVNNPRLTPVEKLFHLKAKTSGEAKAIVAKSPLTNEGFDSAWAALRDRFENKRLLVNSQLKLLFNLGSVTSESGQALKDLQSTIQGCLTALAHSKISTENWDCLLVFLCSSRLPKLTLSLWEKSLSSKSDIPTWDEMNTFLGDRYRTLEAIEDMKPSHSNNSTTKSQPVSRKLNSFEAKVVTKPKNCYLCSKESHPVRLCQRFLQMSVDARANYIKKKQLYRNCFARGHQLQTQAGDALAQFLRNENRLRDFPLKEQYDSVIQEYLDLGHMREILPSYDSPNYYLPQHAVIKPESTTTKLRVVFNASSPSANGTSFFMLVQSYNLI